MLLPESCSIRVDGKVCELPPSYVVSIDAYDGEYMLAVVCDEHRGGLEHRLLALQNDGKIRAGKIHFQSVKAVVTDCVMGAEEDYIDIELKRGVKSERKI